VSSKRPRQARFAAYAAGLCLNTLPRATAARQPHRSPSSLPPPGRTPRGARHRARLTAERLAWVHQARSDIVFESSFQLLVGIVLSAQSTDRMANQLMPELLVRYPGPETLAAADPADVERLLRPIGFFRAKTRALMAASRVLLERYGGQVPHTIAELLTLPGIGRKTANAILGVGFGVPAVVTDRHVIRVAGRLRLVAGIAPELVEAQLRHLLPRPDWTPFSLRMVLHGRYVCVARRPLCEQCVLNDFCPTSTTAPWPIEQRRKLSLSLAGRLQDSPGQLSN
jgi:endonuclease III